MRAAVGFLTMIGGATPPDRRAPAWFGPVGALIGLAVGGVWWAAGEVWSPLIAATLAVAADAALTGMLHLDGLADAADGLLPPLDRARRLAVMASPEVGAFGVVVVVVVVLLRVAALTTLDPDPLLVAGLWMVARSAMAVALARAPYARAAGGGGGLASDFTATATAPAAVGAAVGTGLVMVAAGPGTGGAAAAAALAGFGAVVVLAWRRVGGYTGDVLGAAGVVAETVGLLLAAARW